jgi:hypothetical protein
MDPKLQRDGGHFRKAVVCTLQNKVPDNVWTYASIARMQTKYFVARPTGIQFLPLLRHFPRTQWAPHALM